MSKRYEIDDVMSLPEKGDLSTTPPKSLPCDICGQDLEYPTGQAWKAFRRLKTVEEGAEPGDEPEWVKDGAYDYSKATLTPSKSHEICRNVRALVQTTCSLNRELQSQKSTLSSHRDALAEIVGRMDAEEERPPLRRRLFFHLGARLHRLAAWLQADPGDYDGRTF